MHKLSFEQFKEYLVIGSGEKRGFDLDGVLNTLLWNDNEPYDGDYDNLPGPGLIRQSADSTAFLELLRPGDCVVTARPTRWAYETLKWLDFEGCRTSNIHLRDPTFFKSSKEECIRFKVAVVGSWGVGIYLDDEKSIAEAVQKELPAVIACYLDRGGEETLIVINY